ncbi:uncharacterized protein P174DRAFT_33590 [Aspergillus novofumigatus IBT 16806]|uniref:Uncharacterized protein n=1 Tax=Aspergillus novofumigatus (strain IBT 16806) TaxID=1392255 RepID=A0A2I1CMR5_ASPN1|nr:uncharacterized protein P174DRAFT_33590 [Aspergillus novofumigatus IBT 16806]PKX98924.1 hypothetical protein P174DRAFT_33590 [Aspergillus novofumigatus IBT 16806]
METKDASLPLPDPFLFRTHDPIAASLHLFHAKERIAEGWPSPPLFDCNDTEDITLSLASRAQIGTCQCCRVLLKLGSYLYPRLSLASCTGCRSDCMRKNAIALILMKLRHCGWWNSTERFPEIQQIIRDAFTEDDYEEELKAETLLWNDTPLIRMALEEEVRPSNDAFR